MWRTPVKVDYVLVEDVIPVIEVCMITNGSRNRGRRAEIVKVMEILFDC